MSIIKQPVSIGFMDIKSWLSEATSKLTKSQPDSTRLDCLVLLSYVLEVGQAHILAHIEQLLTAAQINKLNELLERRLLGEPIAYLTKTKEFFGRPFFINENVLIPRPESESFIELLKQNTGKWRSLIDIGTGSGCLAISAKLELPYLEVSATDISHQSLAVAKKNARQLNAKINFIKLDLLNGLPEKYDLFIANLPYIPNNFDIKPSVRFEPPGALYAGHDGLDLYRIFFKQLPEYINPGGLVYIESLEFQHEAIIKLATSHSFKMLTKKGLVLGFQTAN